MIIIILIIIIVSPQFQGAVLKTGRSTYRIQLVGDHPMSEEAIRIWQVPHSWQRMAMYCLGSTLW